MYLKLHNRPSSLPSLYSRTLYPARRPPASTTRSSTASSTRRNRRGMKPGSPPLLSVWMKACNDAPAFKIKKALVNVICPMFICKEWSLCHRQKPWMWSTPGWEVPRLVNWDDSFSLESQQPLLSSSNILLLPFPQSCFPMEGPPCMTSTIAFMRVDIMPRRPPIPKSRPPKIQPDSQSSSHSALQKNCNSETLTRNLSLSQTEDQKLWPFNEYPSVAITTSTCSC